MNASVMGSVMSNDQDRPDLSHERIAIAWPDGDVFCWRNHGR
jgi:hypothetical protein